MREESPSFPSTSRWVVVHGSTWESFDFEEGLNPERGKVVLTNESENRKAVVTADAVRFGGGMGNIATKRAHREASQVPGGSPILPAICRFSRYTGVEAE